MEKSIPLYLVMVYAGLRPAFFMYSIMRTPQTSPSAKRAEQLQHLLEVVNGLIEGSAMLSQQVMVVSNMMADPELPTHPLDESIVGELEQLLTSANLLLYKQQALIKHERIMLRAEESAAATNAAFKARNTKAEA